MTEGYQNEGYLSDIDLKDNKKSSREYTNNLQIERVYGYEEALELAGNGWYNVSLLLVLSFLVLAMTNCIFGFSVVVLGCRCDFNLDLYQQGYLLAATFLGPIVTSYPWGYISDTKGRKICLQYGMTGSFISCVISAFANNWIVLTVLQFITASLCCCGLAIPYTMLEEKYIQRVKSTYMLYMSSGLFLVMSVYFGIGYYILNWDFSYKIHSFTFVPWRLLVLIYALLLGINAILLTFFYESPKFLINVGKKEEAIEILRNIYIRNGGTAVYPVKNIELDEEENIREVNISLWKSLRAQTGPIFRKPFLKRTLQLYFLTSVIYSMDNSFCMWLPFIMDAFFSGISTSSNNSKQVEGLCNMIVQSHNDTIHDNSSCSTKLESSTTLYSVAYGIVFTFLNLAISRFAQRKKLLMILCLLFSGLSAVLSSAIPNNITGITFFMGFLVTGIGMGLLFSFYVDIFPTSHRGMAASLGVLVARLSAITGTSIVGPFIMNHCHTTFYSCGVICFCGAFVAYFLPPDYKKPKNVHSIEQ